MGGQAGADNTRLTHSCDAVAVASGAVLPIAPGVKSPALLTTCGLALLGLLSFAASVQAQEGPYSLQLRWIPGKIYTQETTTETFTGKPTEKKANDVKMKVRQTTVIKVEGEEKGRKEAQVTFESMSGEVMLDGKKQTFDSTDLASAHPLVKSSIGQSVGKSFTLVYDENDKFQAVKDTTNMTAVKEGEPALARLAEAEEVAELYRRSLEMGLPQIKVKPGDRWTSQETLKFPSAGTVKVDLRVKFEALVNYDTGPHAKISFEGDMRNDLDAIESRPVMIDKGSKAYGQILFDLERGTVSFGAFRADIVLDVQGIKVPVRQQVATKLVKIE